MTLPLPTGPRPLGSTGLSASPLAWGMWRLRGGNPDHAARLVNTALDAGITLLDTADIYGPDNAEPWGAAESLLGEVLARTPGLRARMVLASKGGIVIGTPYNSSAAYLIEACEASLTRLRTDHLDLYQIHRPDHLAHPAEVAEALTRLREAGKIRAAGVSNYTVAQTRALAAHLPFKLASLQPEFSALTITPLYDGVLDYAQETGTALLAWSPLAGGRLTGAGRDAHTLAVTTALDHIAAANHVSRAAAAYAWIMAHPAQPIPIIGSQTPDRITDAARALHVKMSRAAWYAVLTAARGEPLP